MRYSEFEKLIEVEGLEVGTYDYNLIVYDPETGDTMLSIGKESTFTFSTNYREFEELTDHDKQIFLDWAIKLASTPLDEREDEKRYRLRLPFAMKYDSYLNLCSDGFFVSSKDSSNDCKTIFTESEIAELKAKHNLDSFVLEEVKEDGN